MQYYRLSGDGKKIGAFGPQGLSIVNAASGQSFAKRVPTDRMVGHINPRNEWRQIFHDCWRVQRDFFYVENMHGVDWDEVRERYGAMIDDCVTRRDLSFILGEIIAELNIGHAYYGGGDQEGQPFDETVGLLGCDFKLVDTEDGLAYQISKIYEGAPWDADARNPLRAMGVDVKEGDFLLEINGTALDTDLDPWASFIGLAGQVTELTVSEKAIVDDDARRVLIEPLRGDRGLRYRDWIEANRKYVEEKSGGRIGYICVPDTGVRGQTDLVRQFFGQRHMDGLIIDERWNGGGQIPTRFIELLNRPATSMWANRHGHDQKWPPDAHFGPKAMLINGQAGSGGDMFPFLFKQAGLGPLIGTRTWGGLVGISGNPMPIDRAFMSVPRFGHYDLDGTWGIEGHGVDPDIEVIDDPALMVDGGDPQLDKAIQVVLDAIEEYVSPFPPRPTDPDRSGMGIREEDK
ncbi:MAG: PDZ domain-containing protein [Phycisphaerales bacterium JB038]